MDSYGNNQFGFMSQQKKFFKTFTKEYLAFLRNAKPSAKQVSEMKNVLSHVWVRQVIYLDFRLTKRENQCLYLSAQGKTIKEIALFFQMSVRRVEQYR
ncbi:helix-turn-helix transcriptional regulator [Legionella sp.]|uniref:helix-turn-helix transcriptional regulator n=1 Tax=Legionella sp. TaxID=459 RepID=UPI003CB3DC41